MSNFTCCRVAFFELRDIMWKSMPTRTVSASPYSMEYTHGCCVPTSVFVCGCENWRGKGSTLRGRCASIQLRIDPRVTRGKFLVSNTLLLVYNTRGKCDCSCRSRKG